MPAGQNRRHDERIQMQRRTKLVVAGLAAALAFGALSSTSSANRIALSGRQWRATWNKLRYVGFVTIECHVTIEGSFHSRTLSKVLEALIGYVTRATVDSTNCTGGSARALTETLPWHIRYGGFTGTLPKIETILLKVAGFRYLIQWGTIECLFASTVSSPMKPTMNINTTTGVAESLRWDETAEIPISSGSSTCSSYRFEGTVNSFTEGPTTTKITVTLVA
jgi:hypothetical protein